MNTTGDIGELGGKAGELGSKAGELGSKAGDPGDLGELGGKAGDPFYEFTDSPNFSKSLLKKEFNMDEKYKKEISYLEPYQMLVRNYISRYTPYENILLYMGLGVGKTCAAISIAEGFRELLTGDNLPGRTGTRRKIVVLVKNKNIQKNFLNELVSECTNEEYNLPTKEMAKKINSLYIFITYGTFVNKVLGIREYEKDDLGMSTSEEIARRKVSDSIVELSNCVIIVDEAHNITNNEIYTALERVLDNSYNTRLVLLTATPVYDNPREIFELANLLNKEVKLPIRNELIKKNYIERYTSKYLHESILKGGVFYPTESGLDILSKSLVGKISYVPINDTSFPKRRDIGRELIPNRKGTMNVVYCQMDRWQYEGYTKALLEETDTSLYKSASDAATIVYPKEMADLESATPSQLYGKEGFLSTFSKRRDTWVLNEEFRDLLTGENLKKISIKLAKLIEYIKRSDGPVFIYSNFVNYGGISLIKLVLTANGYSQGTNGHVREPGQSSLGTFQMYDDSLDPEKRDRLRKLFNSERNKRGDIIKILVGSPIASEGITLKAVRQVHILEPTWNMSKLEQIIGRCIRNYSHHSLPEQDRKVDVFKYVAVYSPKSENEKMPTRFFIDREKYIICEEKDRSNKIVERRLKEIAIDCEKRKGTLQNREDNSAICDYTSCKLKCTHTGSLGGPGGPEGLEGLDETTFNKHINFFGKYEIDYLETFLPSLFKENLLWHYDDIVERAKRASSASGASASGASASGAVSESSIKYTLIQFLNNKKKIKDMYNRDGFLVNSGPWFIFNEEKGDVESSGYSKLFDFSVLPERISLTTWLERKTGKRISSEKKKAKEEPTELSSEDTQYNLKIKDSEEIYGTFYSRFGIKDDNFRIVDKRFLTKEELEDKRKELTGMACNSYSKSELRELIDHLSDKYKLKKPTLSDKREMCDYILKTFTDKQVLLK
jgi:superfamily II DNA or RNA helicase